MALHMSLQKSAQMKIDVFRLLTLLFAVMVLLGIPGRASGKSGAALLSSAEYLQRGKEYHAANQFELACIFYMQALRLSPGSSEALSLRDAAARRIGKTEVLPEKDERPGYRQEVLSFLDRCESLLNLHNVPAVRELYAPDYVNSDGLNRDETMELLSGSWKMYPNLKTTFTDRNITVDGNYAVAECVQPTSGVTAEPYMNVGFARTMSQAKGKLFLIRGLNGWSVIATQVDNQQCRDDCGAASSLPMMLYAPSICESGSTYSVQVQGNVPVSCTSVVSVSNSPLQYPMRPADQDFRVPSNAGYSTRLQANGNYRNEMVTATVKILSRGGGRNNVVGVCILGQHVTMVPPASTVADEAALRKSVQAALTGVSTATMLAAAVPSQQFPVAGPGNQLSGSSKPPASTGKQPAGSQTSVSVTNTIQSEHKRDTPVKDKWALIIGISRFANPAYNLKYAAKDASDFYDYLVHEAGFRQDHVLLLLDDKATKLNIMEAFGEKFLPAVTEDGDLVVVYVSTHGTPANRDKGGRNYIAAWDTDINRLYGTGVDMDEINRRIKESVKSDRVLIVLDTCYSGAGVPGAKGMYAVGNLDAEAMATGSGHLVISSSSPNERSWESQVSPNGVFTKYLLSALRKNSSKTNVKTAFEELKKSVAWEVKNAFGESQTPRLGGDWQGKELILSTPASEPRTVFNKDLIEMMSGKSTSGGAKLPNPPAKVNLTPARAGDLKR
jgi:hypothetical protein